MYIFLERGKEKLGIDTTKGAKVKLEVETGVIQPQIKNTCSHEQILPDVP